MKFEYKPIPLASLSLTFIAVIAILNFSNISIAQHVQENGNLNYKDSTMMRAKPLAGQEQDETKRLLREKRSNRNNLRNSRDLLAREDAYFYSRISGANPYTSIPINESDLVLVGKVVDSQPYFASNNGSIYSEFSVSIEQILKNSGSRRLTYGDLVIAEREGGAITLPNGRTIRYLVSGIGALPDEGNRYVLFLKQNSDDVDYSILVGYEIGTEGIISLSQDGTRHSGKTEFAFIDEIEEAIESNELIKLDQGEITPHIILKQ